MDWATVEGCHAKVNRAEKLLDGGAVEWRAFLNTNPWPHWIDDRTEPGWHRIYFDFSTPLPQRFAVIIGEIAHDLRSALDHLAWREAVECVGLEKAESNAPVITFPLAQRSADFKSAKALRYVGKDARTVMERHQPYKRGKGKGPKSLGLLHWFNRMDKHRTLQAAMIGAPNFFTLAHLGITFAPNARVMAVEPRIRRGRSLEGKTEVVRLRFAANSPDPQVKVNRTPPLTPGFGKPPRPLRGLTITQTIAQVREVIADFADLIP